MVQVLSEKIKKADRGLAIPDPFKNELPSHYSERIGCWYSSISSPNERKKRGQYFTPLSVAHFMGSLISKKSGNLNILDPGAGCGILSCSVCESLVHLKTKPLSIHLDIFEMDENLYPLLEKTLSHLADYLHVRKVHFSYTIERKDFILHHAESLHDTPPLFSPAAKPEYDICISNPPYFKLSKSDPRSIAAEPIVHGQPNIYFLFMAVAASLLKRNGDFIFITPRSFASGSYFQAFRRYFFDLIQPERIHIFNSRKETFKKDNVLQENIIFKGIRLDSWSQKNNLDENAVSISVSHGYEDLGVSFPKSFSLSKLLDNQSSSRIFRIPRNQDEEDVLDTTSSWTGSFAQYGLKISTGPVVAFRAKSCLAAEKEENKEYAPLLWLHHVHPLRMEWPIKNLRKPQYIEVSDVSEKLLVRNQNYVLIRRFSTKEEHRRLIAAPYCEKTIESKYLGLENHLNYIYKKNGVLTNDEIWGISALLNCRIIDTYYRIFNGSTQVGASEIASIPLPDWDIIRKIGARVQSLSDIDAIETIVETMLKS